MGSNYMSMAGISREEMLEETVKLGFVANKVSAAGVVSNLSVHLTSLSRDRHLTCLDI